MSPPPAGLDSAPPSDRRRHSRPEGRTTSRAQLSRHAAFAQVSPEVGELDEQALAEALAGDADAALAMLAEMTNATDERLRAHARRLAARLVVDRVRTGTPSRRGIGRPRRVRADRGGDLDLDASFDAVVGARAERRPVHLEELTARDWGQADLALCLLVDDSGSMTGARLAASAVVAAACALRADGEHAVLAFARDVRPLRRLHDSVPPGALVDRILQLRGHGVTGLAGALSAAGEALSGARAKRRVVVLLSDCRATDDRDPVPAAQAIDELLVIAPADASEAAAELAGAANARWGVLASVDDAPGLLADLLGP